MDGLIKSSKMENKFMQTGNTGHIVSEPFGNPKEQGTYMCRMVSKKGKYNYDFVSYYPERGWLVNWTVTHWAQIVNPNTLDQDPE